MLIGIVLYAVAGALGHLIAPLIALAVFVAVPVFYALTSTGLYKRQPTQRAR
jgi:TMEM175 potassium channel family protein